MNVLNKLIVSSIPLIPKSLVRHFASRYIAGEELSDAVRMVSHLNAQGYRATLDVLGEHISRKEEALLSHETILGVIDAIATEQLDSNISVKLTQLGLKLDREYCLELTSRLAVAAQYGKNFVRIDMEDSSLTDDTLWVYRELGKEFQNVGIVLQAYLYRTEEDARALISEGLKNFRLCKGIYIEPEAIAIRDRKAINANYLKILRTMFDGKAYVGIATHDEALVNAAYSMINEMKLSKDDYEFQMLLGVLPELRSSILNKHHHLRVYVPFGKSWYHYSVRRFKENPQVAGHVFKALFTKNHIN